MIEWKSLVAAATIAVTAIACGNNEGPAGGRVRERQFEPAHYESQPDTCTMIGKVFVCFPNPDRYVGDSWWVYLVDHQEKNEGWREVSQALYEECQIELWCDTDGKHPYPQLDPKLG